MTIEISSDNPRSIRAIELASGAAQWLKCRTRDGRKVYAVSSRSKSGLYHLVDNQSCDCQDAKRHAGQPCMHVLAVRLDCELVKAQQSKPRVQRSPKPATAPAPTDRGVVLSMIRESDGTLSWERAPHTVDRTADVALASRYDSIHDGEAF
jgi:hypothetical protein